MRFLDIFKLVGSIVINNKDANKAIDETTKKGQNLAEKLGGSMQTAGAKISNVGKTLAPVSLAMAGAIGGAVKSASDFQQGMAKMSTLFDSSTVSVSKLSDEFLRLSSDSGVSATELAEAGYQALSAGVDVNKSVKFVKTAASLAKAGFTTTATSVDVLTTAINAYKLSEDDAEGIASKLINTQNLGKTTVDELAAAMGRVIPTASSMNVNLDNLTTSYVELTKQGIATAETTTYINSMFNELGKSTTKTGKILKEKTGKSFQELMASGMSVADVLKILQDYSKETGTNFNELWGSAEAGKAAIALLNGGVDEFNSTVNDMAKDTDRVGEALKKMDTPAVKLKKSLNQIKNAGIELGTALITALTPTITVLANGIAKLTTWFDKLPKPMKTIIATTMAIIAVASPLLIIIGKTISAIGMIIPAISGLFGALKAAVSFLPWLFSFIKAFTTVSIIPRIQGLISALSALWGVLMANPVTLIIAAVAALVVGFVLLWNKCEGFRNFWINFWNDLRNGCVIVWQAIKDAVINYFTLLSEGVQLIGNGIKDFFIGLWNGIYNTTVAVWNAIKTAIETVINAIATVVFTIWNTIKTIIETILNTIKSIIVTAWTAIKTTITTILNGIRAVVSSIWNGIKSVVSGAVGGIRSIVSSGFGAVKSTITSILSGIRGAFTSVFGGIKSFMSGVVSWLKGIFNFHWSLPKLKLPHFKISGSFSLNPPKVPHFGVDWYSKAMEGGFLFTKPTIFGTNSQGYPMGAGEAGDEVMIGKNNMLGMIQTAVSSEISATLAEIKNSFNTIARKTANEGGQGDIVIPVYLGGSLLDEIVVDAKKRVSLRSGGQTNV